MYLIILIPLLIYFLATLTVKRGSITHPDDFYAAFKKVGKTEFSSSSVAYGFQVSTIYPYLFWGASFMLLAPLLNSVFWGVGILLFLFSFNKISKYIGKGETLFGLLGDHYGPQVRVAASIMTIIGFIGYIIAELWFGTRVLLPLITSDIVLYAIVLMFIAFIALYLYRGGQVSSILTDQLQLMFSYIGVFGIIIYFLYLTLSSSMMLSSSLPWGLILMSVLMIIILAIRRGRFLSLDHRLNKWLNLLVVVFFAAVVIIAMAILFTKSDFSMPSGLNLDGFGIAGAISLIILPLSWQFVDMTSWQRLLSVGGSEEEPSRDKAIKKGLLTFAIESPFTWILFIVFGVLVGTALPGWSFSDILIDLPQKLISSNQFLDQIVGYSFITSILSIMLSTVDSFIMGISFTFTYDLNRKSRMKLDEGVDFKEQDIINIIRGGISFGIFIVILSFALFILFDRSISGGGELFINLLLTFYTAVLAFLPLVIGMLFLRKRISPLWALASIVLGATAGIGLGLYSIFIDNSLVWYPIISCLIVSATIYSIGTFISPNK